MPIAKSMYSNPSSASLIYQRLRSENTKLKEYNARLADELKATERKRADGRKMPATERSATVLMMANRQNVSEERLRAFHRLNLEARKKSHREKI
jgi:hypothetical protein